MLLKGWSPTRITAVYCTSSLVTCVGIPVFLFAVAHFVRIDHSPYSWPFLGVILALMASGVGLAWKLHGVLADGVRNERWSDTELRGTRMFVEHPASRVFRWIAWGIALLLSILVAYEGKWSVNPLLWCLLGVQTPYEKLIEALKDPKPLPQVAMLQNPAPLRSATGAVRLESS